MAEVQTTTLSGELTQRFIEFVMMQAQNAALFLGQIPGQGEVNLELARMFIDQLSMIQEKTRGNLSSEEAAVLRNTLSNLQIAFVEVSQAQGGAGGVSRPPQQDLAPSADETPPAASEAATETPAAAAPTAPEGESRKKFTKSYGA